MDKTIPSRSNHREVEVLDALHQLGGAARNANLAEMLGVSEETIRRTTKSLAKAGLVRRVHGGSYLPDSGPESGVFSRLAVRKGEKSRIGEATVALIPEGACIYLDVGSTTAFVAQALNARNGHTIVTNSWNAAQALAEHGGHQVYVAGGMLRRAEWGVFGPETVDFVGKFNIDVAVMSVDGIDSHSGFMLNGSEELAVARAVVGRARKIIVVADHQKFGQAAPLVICPPQLVDMVVSDEPPDGQMAQKFAEWEIRSLDAGKRRGQP